MCKHIMLHTLCGNLRCMLALASLCCVCKRTSFVGECVSSRSDGQNSALCLLNLAQWRRYEHDAYSSCGCVLVAGCSHTKTHKLCPTIEIHIPNSIHVRIRGGNGVSFLWASFNTLYGKAFLWVCCKATGKRLQPSPQIVVASSVPAHRFISEAGACFVRCQLAMPVVWIGM